MRLLFCSYHCLADPSRGAALTARDLLALLAGRGWPCQALCGPQAGFVEQQSPGQLLGDQQVPFVVRYHEAGDGSFAVAHAELDGVPVVVYCPARIDRLNPTLEEGQSFLALLDRLLERFRPDLVLTYGGDPLAHAVIAHARRHGARVVVALHDAAHHEASFFRPVDAVLVHSEFARGHCRRSLGLDCTVLPVAVNGKRVRCPEVRGQYATFVNPQPAKGAAVFARLAHELGRQRPDIPLLVVEGRAKAAALERTGIDLADVGNLNVMANTPDPRQFYGVSRLVLVPSLAEEWSGRIAVEALMNGIPVLASRRGALPEVLRQAGFLFDVPERCTAEPGVVPTAEEVAPWVETITRLWDDAALYEQEQRRCHKATEAWRPERLGDLYAAFFRQLAGDLPAAPA